MMAKVINPLETNHQVSSKKTTRESLFVIDVDGLIDYYNPQFKLIVYPSSDISVGHLYLDVFDRIAEVSENPRQALMMLKDAYANRQQQCTFCLSIVKPTRHAWQLTFFPLMIRDHYIGWCGTIQILDSITPASPASPQKEIEKLHTSSKGRSVEPSAVPSTFVVGDLSIDFARRRVQVRGRSIHLTSKEFSLLYTLAMNAGHTLTANYLLVTIWGPSYTEATHILWTNISRLRKKLGDTSVNQRYIVTDHVGYFMPHEQL